MHEQSLARSRGAPEGELTQIVQLVGSYLVGHILALVECLDLGVQSLEQLVGCPTEAVQVELGEEQSQVLEVLPADGSCPPKVDRLGVTDDILVVGQQHIYVQLAAIGQMLDDCPVDQRDVVLVQVLECGRLQRLGEFLQGLAAEDREQVLVENEPLGEVHRLLAAALLSFRRRHDPS